MAPPPLVAAAEPVDPRKHPALQGWAQDVGRGILVLHKKLEDSLCAGFQKFGSHVAKARLAFLVIHVFDWFASFCFFAQVSIRSTCSCTIQRITFWVFHCWRAMT